MFHRNAYSFLNVARSVMLSWYGMLVVPIISKCVTENPVLQKMNMDFKLEASMNCYGHLYLF